MEGGPLQPTSGQGPALPVPQAQAGPLLLYRERGEGWDETVSVEKFFESRPEGRFLLGAMPHEPRGRLFQIAAEAAILLGVGLLLVCAPWKIKHLFHKPAVQEMVVLTHLPEPLREDLKSDELGVQLREVNRSLSEKNWVAAVQQAEILVADPHMFALAQSRPSAYRWLLDVLVAGRTLLGENDRSNPLYHYQKAVRHFEGLAIGFPDPGLNVMYSYCWALFQVQGGVSLTDGSLSQSQKEGQARKMLAALARLRNSYGAALEKEKEMRPKLLKIEGYSLARALEGSKSWGQIGRFDRDDRPNLARWYRFEDVLKEWEGEAPGERDRDLLWLRLWFWETIDGFTFNPWKSSVTIGNRTYSTSRADAEQKRLKTLLGGER